VSRPKKPFQLLRRKAKNSKYVYYVSFQMPDGSKTSPRSSGKTSKGAAESQVYALPSAFSFIHFWIG
jgi:hypothetical protein